MSKNWQNVYNNKAIFAVDIAKIAFVGFKETIAERINKSVWENLMEFCYAATWTIHF